MGKPSPAAIRAAVPLTRLPTYLPDPRVCTICGEAVDPDDLPCQAWREHDSNDRPIAGPHAIVFTGPLHTACRKVLDDHPRLYESIDGLPGSFPMICGPCDFREGLSCMHPDLKANGGEGLLVTLSGMRGHMHIRGRGCVELPKTARLCAGRRVP